MDAFANLTESLLYEDCNTSLDGSYQQDSRLEESLIAQNKREDGGMLYSNIEGSAMEDLTQALETEMSIHSAEKQDCNEIQTKDKGPFQSPSLNFALNEDEEEKTEQNKISLCMQRWLMGKTLFERPEFTCSGLLFPSSMNLTIGMAAKTDKCSFKLISAMRGSREQNGLGPRPKLRVKWAPDVREPRPSCVSHTVKSHSQYRSKKDHKHKQKGKSSHTNGSNKKHHSKRRDNSEGVHSRLQSSSVHGNRILLDVSIPKVSVRISENSRIRVSEASIFSTQMVRISTPLVPSKHSEQCRRDGKHRFVTTTSSYIDFSLLYDSKWAGGSFRRNLQGKYHAKATRKA